MSIHIVTHCYAGLLPQYAQHLTYQLSSLVINKPAVPFRITVCLSFTDNRTIEVVNWFRDNHPELNLHTISMDHRHLFRRAIGRNLARIGAAEELTWFTDVDHFFGDDCLNSLWLTWARMQTHYTNVAMLWPKSILIHKDHATGDKETAAVTEPRLIEIDPTLFVPKTYTRAIGGIQIVPKSYLDKHGYLNGDATYQQLVNDLSKPFACFRDDVAFRSLCHKRGKVVSISLPNLFRMRHSATTYQHQVHTNSEQY